MTATTKEQREAVERQIADHPGTHKTGCFLLTDVATLLSDSERLAAIEEVKLEDLPENVYLGDGRRADAVHDALLSLSAKVAELNAENETFVQLRGDLEALSSWQIRAEEAEAKVTKQEEEIERLRHELTATCFDAIEAADQRAENWRALGDSGIKWMERAKAAESERDTLRRLLTDALFALECIANSANELLNEMVANPTKQGNWGGLAAHVQISRRVLDTIRAQMEALHG